MIGEGRGARALRLTSILGLAEVVVWLLLGWAKGTGIVNYAADHFGDITIGLATTAYVVFTYHLLESAEAQRRLAIEPYISVRWYESNERAEYSLAELDQWVTTACEAVNSTGIVTLDPKAMPAPRGSRYVNLELTSESDVRITWLKLNVITQASHPSIPHMQLRMDGKFNLNKKMEKGERLVVTVGDVGPIPAGTPVSLRIVSLVYGPSDTSVRVSTFGGESTAAAAGVLFVRHETAPIPEKADA